MKQITLLLAYIVITSLPVVAQKIKVVSATRQDWSGGIAGRRGSNYVFVIEMSGYKKQPVPDSLWFDERVVGLRTDAKGGGNGHIKRTVLKNSIQFEIRAGVSHDERKENAPGDKPWKIMPPKKYKGVALLSYKYQGKRIFYEIPKITKTLEQLSYP